jgi:hypothetical protein
LKRLSHGYSYVSRWSLFDAYEVYKEVPPKVEYSLTAKGKSFIPVMESMGEWGEKHIRM